MKLIYIYCKILILSVLMFGATASAGWAQNNTIFDDAEFIVTPEDKINTPSSEISPVYVDGALYFARIPEYYFNDQKRMKNNTAFYTMFNAAVNELGKVNTSARLLPGFGGDKHEGPVAYCDSTGELFVTVSNIVSPSVNNNGLNRLQLEIWQFVKGKWQSAGQLPFNNRNYNVAHPAISITGDTLIFSSDMDSLSYGEADLYMSVRKDGEWSAPRNLGGYINTPGNEYFPVILPGGILSFASDGRTINRGGLDIYYTGFPDPGRIESPGGVINSSHDDFGLIIHENGEVGYFTSNRLTGKSDDLFLVEINKLDNSVSGLVTDSLTGLPVANSKVSLNKCNGALLNATVTDSTGNFTIKARFPDCVQLEAVKEGYHTFTEEVSNRKFMEIKLVADTLNLVD